MFLFLYNILWSLFIILSAPYWFIILLTNPTKAKDRFGLFKIKDNSIWIHCASVGEVKLAISFINSFDLLPNNPVLLTIVTDTGYNLASTSNLAPNISIHYAPFDWFLSLIKILSSKIKSIIIIETELWPSLLFFAKKTKKPISIINGRISNKSYKKYLFLSKFLKTLFQNVQTVVTRSNEDKKRFTSLGFKNVELGGNMKYDMDNNDTSKMAPIHPSITKSNRTIFVAGSIRSDEEKFLINIYKNLNDKNILLILAPRHLTNIHHIENSLTHNKLIYKKYSELTDNALPNNVEVLIIDKIGILNQLYELADVVFVGGSLVNKGGHNLIEPLNFGKPVLFGPYMDNFKEESKSALAHNAVIQILDISDAVINIKKILQNQEFRNALENNALNFIANMKGSIKKTMSILKNHDII